MSKEIHHLHRRKRLYQKLERYPHPDFFIRILDKILLCIAVIGPLMNIPQIFKIFTLKNSTGVSTLSFLFFAIFDVPWILYGVIHKERLIVIAYILWLLTNSIIVIGTLIYS